MLLIPHPLSRAPLRWKVFLAVVPILVLGNVILITLNIKLQESYLIDSNERLLTNFVNQVVFGISRGYDVEDSRSLFSLVTDYVDSDERILGMTITNARSEITADLDSSRVFTANHSAPASHVLRGANTILQQRSIGSLVVYSIAAPIVALQDPRVLGVLEIEYDATSLFATLHEVKRQAWLWSLLLVLLVGVGIVLLLERDITGPLRRLTRVIGDFEFAPTQKLRLPEQHTKEIRVLSETFSTLIEQLRRSHLELQSHAQDLEEAYQELQETQTQLIQGEKMAMVGQLTAGITHEINNPMNFVAGNLRLINGYWLDICRLLEKYDDSVVHDGAKDDIELLKNEINYDDIRDNFPKAILDTETGAKRTIDIVRELGKFSRVEAGTTQPTNICETIDTTLKLIGPNVGANITIIKDYHELPDCECNPGSMNQVFMNLIINAIQAIDSQKGQIIIRTRVDDEYIRVEIQDDGPGIPDDIVGRVFDPFFTTKEIGQGTGLGLGISYRIVADQGGKLELHSVLTQGTTMLVYLKLKTGANNGG